MKTRLGKKGFTLVEIMIVVAIIGLLAAIAIPNLLRARINSNDSAVQGDLRAFSTAAESFRAAQQPPTYGTAAAMVAAVPPYLDNTWDDAGLVKHGHTIAHTIGAPPTASYSLVGAFQANQALRHFCIDQSGVLFTSVAAAAPGATAAGCDGAGWTPVQ